MNNTLEPELAEALRIILQAEFGTFTVDYIAQKAGCRGTYWEDAAKVLNQYYERSNREKQTQRGRY